MEIRPTREQEREAKDYVLRRVRVELSAMADCKEAVREACMEIARVAAKYKISPKMFRFSANPRLRKEVDKILEKLRWAIEDAVEERIVPEETEDDDKTQIWTDMKGEVFGATFAQRLAAVSARFERETEERIAAGLWLGMDADEMGQHLWNYADAPWADPWLKGAVGAGLAALSGGRPKGTSGDSLSRLARTTIAMGWMSWWYKRGGRIFYVGRGSSYPCSLCDSKVGLHYGTDDLPPYHPNCKCWAVALDI